MVESNALINSSHGILMVLCVVCCVYFIIEKKFPNKIMKYLPPLIWIYITPIFLSNLNLIPTKAPIYGDLKKYLIPLFICILLLEVDIKSTIKSLKRGIFVMLFGTLGVVVGAAVSFLLLKWAFSIDAWKAFGTLAGSWIGGTGNMAAVAAGLDTSGELFGLAVLADTLICVIWLPVLFASKHIKDKFNKFTRVSDEHINNIEQFIDEYEHKSKEVDFIHVIYLLTIGFIVMWLADVLSGVLPELQPVFTKGTWHILIITTLALVAALTPAKKIPGSKAIAMALIYLFVARMGATTGLENIGQAPWFLLAGFIWIIIHGFFCILGARIFRVGINTAAIASAANIGGAATAPIVAAYHRKELVPISIVMALVGYALGNYVAFFIAQLCYWISLI